MNSFRYFWHDVLLLLGTEGIDFVMCLEEGCGKRYLYLQLHLKSAHSMSGAQYKTKHPGAVLQCSRSVMCMADTNRGRTAATHPHLARMAAKLRGRTKETHAGPAATSKALTGRTKHTHKYLALRSERMTGRTAANESYIAAWAEKRRGLTKHNDPGHARQAAALTGRTKLTHPGPAAQSAKMLGRTALTHPSIARQAAKTRGRTKHTHPGPAAASAKLYGRTKETYSYLAARSEKFSGRTAATHPYIARQAEKRRVLWRSSDWRETLVDGLVDGTRGNETKHHAQLKQGVREIFEAVDFITITEKWITINDHLYRVDIYATRDDCKAIAEVGGCGKQKLIDLYSHYGPENVFHVPYGDEKQVLKELEECLCTVYCI